MLRRALLMIAGWLLTIFVMYGHGAVVVAGPYDSHEACQVAARVNADAVAKRYETTRYLTQTCTPLKRT